MSTSNAQQLIEHIIYHILSQINLYHRRYKSWGSCSPMHWVNKKCVVCVGIPQSSVECEFLIVERPKEFLYIVSRFLHAPQKRATVSYYDMAHATFLLLKQTQTCRHKASRNGTICIIITISHAKHFFMLTL